MAELSTLTRTTPAPRAEGAPHTAGRVATGAGSGSAPRENVYVDDRRGEGGTKTTIRRETAVPGSSSGLRAKAPGRGIAQPSRTGKASVQPVRILSAQDQKIVARADRAKEKARRRVGYGIRTLVALVLVGGLCAIGYYGVPEATRITKVKVSGMKVVNEADVVAALALTPDVNLVNADIAAMKARIAADPRVASVRIGRVLPDGLSIALTERSPVAAVLIEEGGGSRQVLVDSEGVAYAYAESSLAAASSAAGLPVLSGIRFENFKPGQRLPSYLTPLMGDIARIGSEKPALLSAFSEIRVVKLADNEAELLLYPLHRAIPIRMPPALDADKLVSALLLVDILSGREGSAGIEEIDFRTGTVVYRTKEGQPG